VFVQNNIDVCKGEFRLPFALIKLHLIRRATRDTSMFCLAKLGGRLRPCSPAGEGFFSAACDLVLTPEKALDRRGLYSVV